MTAVSGFVSSALRAQRRFQGDMSARHLLGAGLAAASCFSFHRIVFDAKVVLEKGEGGTFLLVFRTKERREELLQHFRMELSAVPAQPSSVLLPATDGTDEQAPTVRVRMPGFMLDADEDLAVREATAEALRAGRVSSPVPNIDPETLAERIASDPEGGRGPIAFRLKSGHFLVVCVSRKGAADDIVVYSSDDLMARVFRTHDAGPARTPIEPLHRLATAARAALFEGATREFEEPAREVKFLAALASFAEQLRKAYARAIELTATTAAPPTVNPAYLEVVRFDALIRYRVALGHPVAETDDFAGRTSAEISGGIPADVPPLSGGASIAFSTVGRDVRTEVVVGMPAFILTGEDLSEFVALARIHADSIVTAFAEKRVPASEYRSALAERGDVIVVREIDDDGPNGSVLVVWPAIGDHAGRDFVFTCAAKGQTISDVNPVLKIGRDFETETLDESEYKPFHNMFHAAVLWTTEMRKG